MTDKPEIDFPEGPPPGDLEITDLAVGDGAEATHGSTAVVHYVGVAYSSGEEFDASWNRGQSFAFPLGGRQRNHPAGHRGVVGMKVGGRRRLVIPPELGYGDRGAGSVIRPGRPSSSWSTSSTSGEPSPLAVPRMFTEPDHCWGQRAGRRRSADRRGTGRFWGHVRAQD